MTPKAEPKANSTVEYGPGYAKVSTWMQEKVGLPEYSNVEYGASVQRFTGDGDEEVNALLHSNEVLIETWMKDYFRREVVTMLDSGKR